MNCSLIFYLVSVISGGKTYLGFSSLLHTVCWIMWDRYFSLTFHGFLFQLPILCAAGGVIQSPPLLLRNFSVLTGTFLCLILIGFL